MPRPDVLVFVFLAGLGCGIGLSLLAVWLAEKFIVDTMPPHRYAPMTGLEVRDSSMGEFDAAVRGRA